MSNYVNITSNELANTLQATSNVISERITSLNAGTDAAMSNYVNTTSNELANTLQSTSNVISTRISDLDMGMSNYVNNTSNELGNTLQSTSNTISERITALNADMIADGTSHRFIINDAYDNDIDIEWDHQYDDCWTDRKGGYDVTYEYGDDDSWHHEPPPPPDTHKCTKCKWTGRKYETDTQYLDEQGNVIEDYWSSEIEASSEKHICPM